MLLKSALVRETNSPGTSSSMEWDIASGHLPKVKSFLQIIGK